MPADQYRGRRQVDVVVVGGGQSGLAVGYYLRRTGLSFVILDAQAEPGGAWQHAWNSLHLFSPAQFSSLPGWLLEGGPDYYPARDEVIEYLRCYEERYNLPIERPVHVEAVRREGDHLQVETDRGIWLASVVVSATGSWSRPYTPEYPGRESFRGEQLHSARYLSPDPLAGSRVLVIGGGNSGAQILAEVSQVADATWVTLKEPTFLPDHVDGRYLFDQATARYRAQREGRPAPEPASLGDIVMVPPTLEHLRPLGVIEPSGRVELEGNRSIREPRLWLVGYGDWTGFASATLIGVGRSARSVVSEIEWQLKGVVSG